MIYALMLALSIVATRDGDTVTVVVPRSWEHVEITTEPPAEFVQIGAHTFQADTPADVVEVFAAVCDNDSCTPVWGRAPIRHAGEGPEENNFPLFVILLGIIAAIIIAVSACNNALDTGGQK